MCLDDVITLDDLIDETLDWFAQIKMKCKPTGPWWNFRDNVPDVGGIYIVAKLKNNEWLLDTAGVYDCGKPKHIRTAKKYLFLFKGINWDENNLRNEVIKQYKDFRQNAKIISLNVDFV